MNITYISAEKPYADVVALQEKLVADVIGGEEEQLLFCEHAPVYTLGSSAKESDVLHINDIPVVHTGRGGQVTYHGPGQRVVYPIIDLKNRGRDIRKYICDLQNWLINTLAHLDVEAYSRDEVGVWVDIDGKPHKIAAIGVRVRKWVTFHGIALNVSPNLEHFKGIIPCGLAGVGVTSLADLGKETDLNKIDHLLQQAFSHKFNVEIHS
jgi:lipoyl(octanoyl) transferase